MRSTRRESNRAYPVATVDVSTVEVPPETAELIEATPDDDRGKIEPGDRVILIVEDDSNYARILVDAAHEKGFKAIVTPRGAPALSMAREMKPDVITLDINLPDDDGWHVLDRLKVDLATRHIPIQIRSRERV